MQRCGVNGTLTIYLQHPYPLNICPKLLEFLFYFFLQWYLDCSIKKSDWVVMLILCELLEKAMSNLFS